MQKSAWISIFAFTSLILVADASAQVTEGDKDETNKRDFNSGPGIEVGTQLPAITLKDQNGREVSLEDLSKSKNLALIFYRSADW